MKKKHVRVFDRYSTINAFAFLSEEVSLMLQKTQFFSLCLIHIKLVFFFKISLDMNLVFLTRRYLDLCHLFAKCAIT